jgi:hypothetical protein
MSDQDLRNQLGKAIRSHAERLYESDAVDDLGGQDRADWSNTYECALGLARAIERGLLDRDGVHEVMEAPGDWSYSSPIGKALHALYSSPKDEPACPVDVGLDEELDTIVTTLETLATTAERVHKRVHSEVASDDIAMLCIELRHLAHYMSTVYRLRLGLSTSGSPCTAPESEVAA